MREYYELYMRCFPDYPTSPENFSALLRPELGHIVERLEDGKLAGYALVHEGSVPVLCVDEAYRGRGIGSGMLVECEGYIRGQGRGKLTLGCGPHYILQGVPDVGDNVRFFEKRGYAAGWTSVNMELDLDRFDASALRIPPAPEGLSYRMAAAADMPELLAAVEAAEPNWPSVFETCIDPIFLAILDGKIVGFEILAPNGGRFIRPGQQVGCVGCVGVIPSMRERGIGMDMVVQGIQWLKEHGSTLVELRYVWLESWYGKLGFRTVARQWMGEKAL